MGKLFSRKKKHSLRNRLIVLSFTAVVPFLALSIYLIISMNQYSKAYDEIVSNMTIANSYNLDFKEQMDESTYKLVVGAVDYDTEDGGTIQNPYELMQDLRDEFLPLLQITTDKDSRKWLQSLLRNLNTLEERMDDIQANLDEGGHYDENIVMLDDNIYILTELIQDDLQHYIYYQASNMETIKRELNARVSAFITTVVIMVIVISILVIFICVSLSYHIVRPVNDLVEVTNQISKGDFSVRAGSANTSEIDSLSHSVNHMAKNLDLLVNQIKEDERKMRQAELRLLQEQINPHFLYNTLDTIVWLIESGMEKEAEEMVVSLSDFFRLVLNHGKEYNTIKDEERHITSYLKIQQVRYQDILEYDIQIPPELYDYQILKMTLQPLVENALYHGIKYKRAKGTIKVYGEKDGDIIMLSVEDNGVGMEEDELKRLREEINRPCKETQKGFGLANVNERIKMNFGAKYGMKIESEKGKGTIVHVIIPAIRIEGKEDEG
ncbi:MAG: sensor histidine kinase [Agathobacter sp.]